MASLFLLKNPSFHKILLFTLFLSQKLISHSKEIINNWFQKKPSFDATTFHDSISPEMSVVDLPELPLDCILKKLSPFELYNMSFVCKSLRVRCRSDDFWERHVREKWGRVIGEEGRRNWELFVEERRDFDIRSDWKVWIFRLDCLRGISWLKHKMKCGRICSRASWQADCSLVSFYLALESGRFSFRAQVYNRENGHTGFFMSCYDAEISYNATTNKFFARYPPHGKRIPAIEEVPWERTRAPPVVTSAHELHISDCLSNLQPGDHFEIQWRRNKDYPYGWWYGVVGHLEMCDRTDNRCCCGLNETIVLEFNHYSSGSRWRRKTINRNEHREDGDENYGFYGGILKIENKEEISNWMRFWPAQFI